MQILNKFKSKIGENLVTLNVLVRGCVFLSQLGQLVGG